MAGSNTSTHNDRTPRVFISYARSDGEQFAAELRQRLQAEHIPLWQDRVGMEGGRDWRQQITEALDKAEFMVLVMTPGAMRSEMVREEWRYARQQGVCVYPVKGAPDLDFNSLPHWMRRVHFYDINYEWQKLVNDLNTPCQRVRVPFMVEDLPTDYVPRPQEFEVLIDKLLDRQREEPVAITAALRGAGGYGKTTMAKALCHDKRIQEAFDDGILWVTLGEHPSNLLGKVEDLIYILSHERPSFTGIDAAGARLAELLADRDILLVVDDVWDAIHLKPFLQGGKRCARLITTRNQDALPFNAQSLIVDAMQPDEAVQLLSAGLEGAGHFSNGKALRTLSARLGEWPLLLRLVNSTLRERVSKNQSVHDALAYVNEALDECGLTTFDARNAQDRSQAVTKTLSVSFKLLTPDEYTRYKELAIFPEDVDIPLSTLEKLWGSTGRLGKFKTEKLCEDFSRLSLILAFNPTTRTIRLHDVIRSYLQTVIGTRLPALHEQLLDAYALKRWADLPEDEPYLWDHLVEHLIAAGHLEELLATVKDLRYLAHKTLVRTAYAAEADLAAAEQRMPSDVPLRLLTRNFANMGHLLNHCNTYHDIAAVLYSRLVHLQELSDLCQAFEQDIPRPYLATWHLLPDLPYPALLRTFNHTSEVMGCAVSPDSSFIVSACVDGTLKLWDATTGAERFTLSGHTIGVAGCAVSPDGHLIVSACFDGTLKLWDTATGKERFTLSGHRDGVMSCLVSPDGHLIVSASADSTLKLWDAATGKELFTFLSYTGPVMGCAMSPDGSFIVSAYLDGTLKVWDVATRKERLTLSGHRDAVTGCAVSPDSRFIVSSSDDIIRRKDHTLRVWDAATGAERFTFSGHTGGVTGCAVSPDSRFIVSSSHDGTLKVWNISTSTKPFTRSGYTDGVKRCAVSPDGRWIVSTDTWDGTHKIWDARTGVERFVLSYIPGTLNTFKVWNTTTGKEHFTLSGRKHEIIDYNVSSDGRFIVSSSEGMFKVWDIITRKERFTFSDHTGKFTNCVVSPDNRFIVFSSSDGTFKVLDITARTKPFTLPGRTGKITSYAVSPDSRFLVSASSDGTLTVWDIATRAEPFTLSGPMREITSYVVSPDSRFLVSVSQGYTALQVWGITTRGKRFTLSGHTNRVGGCAVSPDSRFIVSVSWDKTLKVWESRTGRCVLTFPVDGELFGCAFYPDGKHLVACGGQGLYFLRLVK